MNGFFKWRRFVGVTGAVAGGLLAIHPARGARAYLPVVGPPSLRLQVITKNHLVFNLESFREPPKAAETNTVAHTVAPAAVATNIIAAPNPIPIVAANTNQANQVPAKPETVADAKNNPVPPFNFPNPSAAASDLLTVTPQMITEYLKPAQNAADQPGTVVFVPVEMQFTPPTPKTSGESQAIYKVP